MTVTLKFIEIFSVSAQSISATILAHLFRICIDLPKLIGQGYNGAMVGRVSGVQKCICGKYPQAIFVYCSAHFLNLFIID